MKEESIVNYIRHQFVLYKMTKFNDLDSERKYLETIAKRIISKVKTGKAFIRVR